MAILPLKPLKIAMVAPLCEATPPKLYGGTERVVANLTDALVGLGHQVTLFASGDSVTNAKLATGRAQAIRLDPAPLKSEPAAHFSMLFDLAAEVHKYDVLHFHTDLWHLPFFQHVASRSLTTLHGRLDIKDLSPFYARFSAYPLVSISNNQRAPMPDANWFATVHHGLPVHIYPFTAHPLGGYLAFLGRISPEKRPDRAIALAKASGIPLKIAAKVDAADRAYFETEIKPLLDDPLIEFIGEISDAEKGAFLGNALALLFPIDWPEPFGLVMIEAMACGTPVIAFRCGSVPEVLSDGVSGRIVTSEAEALEAIRGLSWLDRRAVRGEFEQRFTSLVMARNYQRLYYELIGVRTDGPNLDAAASGSLKKLG
ncbi:glycosyltransferase involved in cell wall biosynthesis [Rhizomicrobium palustre]|uniref:Glycosyltransferase involved in cell wall biosynthesis n=1 Tax=Rhizomicrobium palustre TaxID=189966 RepID=A0A846MZQ4_9PROT|nr:glycosyltransferase family 4 protein [Rhizomicrobium palustre]NIK88581.1 glycosyltransferase involved in cell wall biosynthesis [Rhizomicrobium palustre]